MRQAWVAAVILLMSVAAVRGQSLPTLPTPLPQPFSPNGVLRPIIPFQPAVPVPTIRPLSVVPLPTPVPNLRIAPLKTPQSNVASQTQNLIKQVPIHRRWPILEPRDPSAGAGAGAGPAAGSGAGRAAAGTFVPSRMTGAATAGRAGAPDYRRPLGW